MELNLQQRLELLKILPAEGNFSTLKIVRVLQDSLSLSESEFKEYEVVEKQGMVYWNEKGKVPKEISIGDKAKEIIVNTLKELDNKNKLNIQHIPLWEKFVEED